MRNTAFAGGTRRGGFGGFELANVYEEVGDCANPLGAIGQAGVIAQGSTVKIQGGEAPNGAAPAVCQHRNAPTTATTLWRITRRTARRIRFMPGTR